MDRCNHVPFPDPGVRQGFFGWARTIWASGQRRARAALFPRPMSPVVGVPAPPDERAIEPEPAHDEPPAEHEAWPLPQPGDRRLLVVGTPKTGSTWVKYLLAAAYDVPIAGISPAPDLAEVAALGSRWVAQQHFFPRPHHLAGLRRLGVVVVTPVRHPGDILVSLYHFVRAFPDAPTFDEHLRCQMLTPPASPGDETVADAASVGAYVRDRFFVDLLVSVAWLRTGEGHRVRYEDLWRDPVAALRALTDRIQPLPTDTLERAVAQCDIDALRQLPGIQPQFFRRGEIGGWREALPPSVVDLLRTQEPYPALFAALGYTLDPTDPLIAAPAQPRPERNPFRGVAAFDNGVPVPALAVRLYLSVEAGVSARWPTVTATTGPDTFYQWANGPAPHDPDPGHPLLITALAAHAYGMRADLVLTYPDLFGHDRAAFALWFVHYGGAECALDDAFIRPVRATLLPWARTLAADDPGGAIPVRLTELAAHIHRRRPDLQAAFPDPYGGDRLRYLLWFIQAAATEYGLDEGVVEPVRAALLAWGSGPAADPRAEAGPVLITALAAALHREDSAAQALFPDLYGQHRLDYLLWLLEEGRFEYQLDSALLAPIVRSWAEAVPLAVARE